MDEIERRLRILQLSYRPDKSAHELVEYARILDEYVVSGGAAVAAPIPTERQAHEARKTIRINRE